MIDNQQTNYKTCPHCRGIKTYMAIGMITKDCHVCNKIGHVSIAKYNELTGSNLEVPNNDLGKIADDDANKMPEPDLANNPQFFKAKEEVPVKVKGKPGRPKGKPNTKTYDRFKSDGKLKDVVAK